MSTAPDSDIDTAIAGDFPATEDAEYFEYTSSANPIGARLIPPIPYHSFLAELYNSGPTRLVPLDLSEQLQCDGPATGPGLCAHFVRVLDGDSLTLEGNATSLVFYVVEGNGLVSQDNTAFGFAKGDFFTFPGGADVTLEAWSNARLYYVNDAPLLRYLGAGVTEPRFQPTLYPAAAADAELRKVAEDANAGRRNRVSVLLGNRRFPRTRTVTHSMWAMYGMISAHSEQKPHRHQSIALDFIVDCEPGCYSLVGTELDAAGNIAHPRRVDWEPGMAFVTPPGYWHAHYNTSDSNGYLIPIQDAGLHTYLRSLDIRFSH